MRRDDLIAKAESGADWAHIAFLEAKALGGPFFAETIYRCTRCGHTDINPSALCAPIPEGLP